MHAPDVVGNIRVDQAWGLFQISAAAHEVNASYNSLGISGLPTGLAGPNPFGPSEPSGHPDTKWGGSVMAALQIKNIPTGAGDDFKIDASYAKGDTKNVISTSATSPNFAMFSGTNRPGAYNSVGFGVATDALYLPAGFAHPALGAASGLGDGRLHLTEAYGIRGIHGVREFVSYSPGAYAPASYGLATTPNLRGDTAETYFRRTECIAGVQDMRFQELMPDVFHWLGISRIDRWVSMSNMKHEALRAQGIEIVDQVAIPEGLIPLDAQVEMTAKKAAGYFTPAGVPSRTQLRRTKGRALDA